MNNHIVYDIAQWIVYNIEDLSLQYMDSESMLPLEVYLMNRAVVLFKEKYNPEEIRSSFSDYRIQVILDFYQEERDESTDSLH